MKVTGLPLQTLLKSEVMVTLDANDVVMVKFKISVAHPNTDV